MLRVLQLGFGETLVVVDGPVSDDLNLRDPRDRSQVGMEDRFSVSFGSLFP